MKKNFLKVAALLIAAMLMVVSCTQEVAPKNEGNELVEVKIGIGRSSRDITITPNDGENKITYMYTLTPEWSMVGNGTPIYGAVTTETKIGNETYTIDATPSVTTLGLVTPGLWKVEVFGYMKQGNADVLVLNGATTAYFATGANTKTVFVAPVSSASGSGTVSFELYMQDLGTESTLNNIKYTIQTLDLGDNGKSEGTLTPTITNHVGKYETTKGVTVKAGFNTVTLSIVDDEGNVEEGGITKTFLMLPGRTVTIRGSVYPSEFVDSPIKISVIDLSDVSLSIKDADGEPRTLEEVVDSHNPNTKVKMFVLDKDTEYTFSLTDDAKALNAIPVEAKNINRTYQWYLGGSAVPSARAAETNSTSLGIISVPGDYAITCVTTYEFTIDGQNYKIKASATEGKVRVK